MILCWTSWRGIWQDIEIQGWFTHIIQECKRKHRQQKHGTSQSPSVPAVVHSGCYYHKHMYVHCLCDITQLVCACGCILCCGNNREIALTSPTLWLRNVQFESLILPWQQPKIDVDHRFTIMPVTESVLFFLFSKLQFIFGNGKLISTKDTKNRIIWWCLIAP